MMMVQGLWNFNLATIHFASSINISVSFKENLIADLQPLCMLATFKASSGKVLLRAFYLIIMTTETSTQYHMKMLFF